jgi:hypothetical protein
MSRIERSQRLEAYKWLAEHVQQEPAVICYWDTEMYLYTGWHGYRIQPLTKASYENSRSGILSTFLGVSESARIHKARYIVSSAGDYEFDAILCDRATRERLLKQNRGVRTVYRTPDVRVYSVD